MYQRIYFSHNNNVSSIFSHIYYLFSSFESSSSYTIPLSHPHVAWELYRVRDVCVCVYLYLIIFRFAYSYIYLFSSFESSSSCTIPLSHPHVAWVLYRVGDVCVYVSLSHHFSLRVLLHLFIPLLKLRIIIIVYNSTLTPPRGLALGYSWEDNGEDLKV